MKISLKGLTTAATMLAAALGLNLLGPHRAYAAPGNLVLPGESDLGVTILSPDPHVPLTGLKPVEISAFYQGTPGNQIVSVDLILDGVKAASKTLDVPETRGVVSFLVDASQLAAGTHKIVVRATAADQEVKSAKSAFTFGAGDNAEPMSGSPIAPLPVNPAMTSVAAPVLHLVNPAENGKVQGVVTLRVEASDPSGKAPYVSLFIDKTFKTLRNFAPYEFEWDTTNYPNGVHTIEAFGYNDLPNVGHSQAMQIYVNNPGGETHIRRDLLDSPKVVRPVMSDTVQPALPRRASSRLVLAHPANAASRTLASKKSLGRPLPLRRPDLLASEAPFAPMTTARAAATREILRQMARVEHSSMHFGSLNFGTELSSPFATERPAQPGATATPHLMALTPMRGYKPLPAPPAAAATPTATADTPQAGPAPRVPGKITRLQRMASLPLLPTDLAVPVLTAPRIAPEVKIASYRAEMRLARAVVQPALRMHPLRVHFPASLGSLLRSVGQTSILFNHTTVKLDRPIAARQGIVFGPLRQIFEHGGGTLTWQARTGTVHAKNATKDIVLTIGNNQARVNAKTVMLDGKPYLMTGRTMVPLSFVGAALDADVQYDAATGHLLITSKN